MSDAASVVRAADRAPEPRWLTPGVRGIGAASLLADLGHEIPTSLLPSLLTSTLGAPAPAAALGAIEGAASFAAAYLILALTGPSLALLAPGFLLAGIGIGCAETAQHAAVATLAPQQLRGSAFGLLAGLQSLDNLAASTIAGALWTLVSPTAAFLYAAALMMLALPALATTASRATAPHARQP